MTTLFENRMRLTLRLALRGLLAAAAFALVAWGPDLLAAGPLGATSDLGLAALLGKGSALALAVAFAGGVATSLTPCVYPLIPITVSIFGARRAASRRQAMALSGLYVLGIAAMYSGLGLAAALTGRAFGAVMQNPWALGFVALVLAAMAASMFGLFELRLPGALQQRLERVGGAGHAGAFGMGLVSGIIAAPCTGPVLAAALAFVAAKGSPLFGVSIMFTYALGMGLLFFLIGAFSVALPKSGPWMDTVKSVFGVALLAAALVFVLSAVPGARPLFSAAAHASLVAGGVAALGVLLGALHGGFHGPALPRVAKALGVVLLVGGIAYGVGAAGARDRARSADLAWFHGYDEALAAARAQGRPVIIDFWADWCTACKELDRVAWADPGVREEAARFVLLKLDGTNDSPAFNAQVERFGVSGMPTVIFLDGRGREVPDRVMGAIPAAEMLDHLRGVDRACPAAAGGAVATAPAQAGADAPAAMACMARW
jgi:thiol:disulfide interchange protein DsbD